MLRFIAAILSLCLACHVTLAQEKSPYTGTGGGNRFAYLDEVNPYYPHKEFAKLITPQWVGEEGVEAVVILSIDDMRDTARYETFLRPILDRLKKVENSDGLSRMSIFTNAVNPKDEQLQKWLKEGLSFEVHTVTHPCPCLGVAGKGATGDIAKAKQTYDGCVDMLFDIPNYKGPVAFRMPCCDSMNSVSPRFFAEVMNKTTKKGNFLSIDSSVFNIFTSDDPALPRELVQNKDGSERFAPYAAFPGFVNTIENYPYPYTIGNMIWQFPCVVPSDWEAQHLQGKNNPKTVEDMKAALDCTVIKQGTFTLVFHPHGWIKAEQIVELIDHAEKTHGKKVKFLSFGEAMERLNKNLLKGQAVRSGITRDEGIRMIDVDHDGFMDAVIAQHKSRVTRLWSAQRRTWVEFGFPVSGQTSKDAFINDSGIRWGIVSPDRPMVLDLGESHHKGWIYKEGRWIQDETLIDTLEVDNETVVWASMEGVEVGVRIRDIDGDGTSEIIAANSQFHEEDDGDDIDGTTAIFRWSSEHTRWDLMPFRLPRDTTVVFMTGRPNSEAGMRFVDLDHDGDLDIVYSNKDRIGVYLFESMAKGWSRTIVGAKRADLPPEKQIPPIVRADGTNNGFFVKGDALYWQNEDTGAKEPHHVKKITFAEILAMAKQSEPGRAAPDSPVDPNAPAKSNDSGAARPGSLDQSRFTTAHRTPPPLLSPQASLAAIKVRPGFRVELVASEPLTMDPVAFDFGPDGKLWIVEMADYPDGLDAAPGKPGKPGGRVVYLTDTDNDGKYDKRTLFLDGIPFPTGVMVWKKGVLVTAAPDIFYAEDTTPGNADGKADKRETLFTGFGEGNQQHRVNGLRWGLDGWIYLGNGDSGGNVKNVKTGEVVNVNGRDLRIRQKSDGNWEMDPQSGQTQFGRERDDFGNWFGCNNTVPAWHYALEDHYLRRNPHVAPPNPRIELTPDRRVFPISIVFSPSIDNHKVMPGGEGKHTSANSICIYRDDLYGEHFYGNAFVSEPVHNLIRRMVLRRDGVSFRAERAAGEEASEFLASSDPCFRPNMIRTGPDGCLWFADMYRQTIEHPKWIPPAWQATLNLREGDDKGRIYRIVEVSAKPRAAMKMDKLDAKGLVAAMDSPNGWQRDMAQMMLMWNHNRLLDERSMQRLEAYEQDLAILPPGTDDYARKQKEIDDWRGSHVVMGPIDELIRKGKSPAVKVQAMWSSYSLGWLDSVSLSTAMEDGDSQVRSQAVRLSGMLLADSRRMFHAAVTGNASNVPPNGLGVAATSKLLLERVSKSQDDHTAAVRQELAYALGNWPDAKADIELAKILLKDADDRFITAAALSSVGENVEPVLRAVLASDADIAVRTRIIEPLVATAIGRNELGAIGGVLEFLATPKDGKYESWQFASLARLLDALDAKKITLAKLRESASPKVIAAIDRLPDLTTKTQAAAADRAQSPDLRIAAISLFSRLGDDKRIETFGSIVMDLQSPPSLQAAAAGAMAKLNTDLARSMLLAGWHAYSPALRASVMDELLRTDKGAAALVSALEAGVISRHDIDPARRQPLLTHKSDAIKTRATKLLGGPVSTDRQKLIDQYEKALALSGDATRGSQVYAKNCAACHKLGDVGNPVGPDLARINDRSGHALVTAVLDPNRAVEAKYINYLADMIDGEKFTGIITTETGTSLTMVGVDGKPRTLLRKNLASLRSLGLSLMPEGLEQAIDGQAMADLVAFVAGHGQPAKQFENNKPVTVKQAADGSLTLPAASAEVFGPSLIFEQQYRNLGWWSSDQDHAIWTLEVLPAKAGKYEVILDYSLANETKTNAFQLLVADQKLTGPVPSTGSWDKYVTKAVGTIELKAGTHRLTFRSLGPVKGALMDLRTIVLKP
ncbi:MAG: PVC-type heme-binding CxxCH protein [Phycisphaeraceae bacterium]